MINQDHRHYRFSVSIADEVIVTRNDPEFDWFFILTLIKLFRIVVISDKQNRGLGQDAIGLIVVWILFRVYLIRGSQIGEV